MVQNHPWTQMSFNSVSHKTGPYGMKPTHYKALQRFFLMKLKLSAMRHCRGEKKLEYVHLSNTPTDCSLFFPAMSYYSFVFGIFGHSIPVMYLTSNLTFS